MSRIREDIDRTHDSRCSYTKDGSAKYKSEHWEVGDSDHDN